MGNLLKTTVTGSDNTTKSITTYAYDHSNGITTVTDTEGNTVTYDYDNSTGLLTKYTDAKGNYKTYTYDALGRTKTVTGTTVVGGTLGNIVNQYTYDGDNVTSITHNGFSYIFGYDQYGHKTSVAIGNSNLEVQSTLVTYGYDDTNNKDLLTSIQYANNQTIGYSYNSDSKLTSTSYNGIVKFEYQYDTANNTETIIDKVNNVTYTVRYDDNDRITSITGTDGSLIQYQYKDENIVSSITSTINGTTKTTSYSYDENDKLIGVTTVNGSTISYSYDSLSRTDKKEITLSNGTYTTSYTYIGGENDTTTGKVASINNNGTVTEYAYDANGNITSITSNGKTITYTYNSLDELVREDNQVLEKTIVYSYDAGGNILSKTEYPYTTSDILGTPINTITYTYDTVWKDKLVEYNGKPITYDDAGNTLTYDGYTFTWEAGRQLAAISGNGQTISYKYNDSGYRTEKTANGVTTKYYLDGDKVILEENGSDSIYYSYDADDKLVSMTLNGTEYFYIRNSQGDITGLIDTEGTQVVSYTYDSWGKLVSIDGSLKDTVGLKNPYRYRGYRYDTETGFYSLQSRYYDPEIGRFINADAVINEGILGANLFAYCENNPIMYIDPDGYGKTYVFYYDNPGSGFKDQAMNSPYYNKNSKDVVMIAVTSVADFKKAWNNMNGTIDLVYLYLHGGTGVLYFKGESMSMSQIKGLNSKSVKYRVYLFSCHGGDGKEGNNVAWAFAKLTSTSVIACTGSVSYSKIFGKYYARKAWDWGIIKTFYYEKQYILWGNVVAKSAWGQW